jgi:hypothetical protein
MAINQFGTAGSKQTWQGKRVDRAFLQTLHDKFAN